MNNQKIKKIYILDTSALLSGKPINLEQNTTYTTNSVNQELKPGGKDYQNFQYQINKGLKLRQPDKKYIQKIKKISEETGDIERLSKTDIEILALCLELKNETKKVTIILTDDYSIQNVANHLKIKYENISQQGIKKRFIWGYRCTGCGKKFKKPIKNCTICGSDIKNIITNKKFIKK